jgi:hypothetical protein
VVRSTSATSASEALFRSKAFDGFAGEDAAIVESESVPSGDRFMKKPAGTSVPTHHRPACRDQPELEDELPDKSGL